MNGRVLPSFEIRKAFSRVPGEKKMQIHTYQTPAMHPSLFLCDFVQTIWWCLEAVAHEL